MSDLILRTVPTPTPSRAASLRIPTPPSCRSARTAFATARRTLSLSSSSLRRPIVFPASLARRRPALWSEQWRPGTAGANSAAGRTQLIDATAIHCNPSSALNLAKTNPRLRPLHLVVRETEFIERREQAQPPGLRTPAKSTNRDARPRSASGARSWPDSRLGLGKLCHTQTTCRCSDNAPGTVAAHRLTLRHRSNRAPAIGRTSSGEALGGHKGPARPGQGGSSREGVSLGKANSI